MSIRAAHLQHYVDGAGARGPLDAPQRQLPKVALPAIVKHPSRAVVLLLLALLLSLLLLPLSCACRLLLTLHIRRQHAAGCPAVVGGWRCTCWAVGR